MAVNVGDLITDTDYNNMRNTVESVLGGPTGTHGSPATNLGYGQPLESSAVANGAQVTADDVNKLILDIYACRLHQVNGTNFGAEQVDVGNIIGANASGLTVDALGLQQRGFNDFLAEADNAYTDRDTHFQVDLTSAVGRTRTTSWGYGGVETITHVITFTWPGQTKTSESGNSKTLSAADHFRAFFNSGGQIIWNASRTGGTQHTKNTDWSNLLGEIQVVIEGDQLRPLINQTPNTLTQDTSLGAYNLTTTDQTLITKTGANYAVNSVVVKAKVDSNTNPSVLTLTITFTDSDDDYGGATFDDGYVEPAVDPSVDGTLTSQALTRIARDQFNTAISIDDVTINIAATGTDL